MKAGDIRDFVQRELPALCRPGVGSEAGYALPAASLALLCECAARLGIRRVFEFGTGRSTRAFLDAGCEVASVEDSAEWLSETRRTFGGLPGAPITFFQLPLRLVWHRGAPMRSWLLPATALASLQAAELVLIDSPALPPFREHAFAMALAHARGALIAVDDAGIPTVARFCRRLAGRNGAPFYQADIDHGLFFAGPATREPLDDARSFVETLKAWRRYVHPRCGA